MNLGGMRPLLIFLLLVTNLEMAADDLITFDELRARLLELDERRTTAEQELRALQSRKNTWTS